jgi:hypothetical protein
MATENPTGDSCLVHLALTAWQTTIMRENLCDWLEGVREDLKTPDKLADPEDTRAEAAAYERLLAGVATGRIAVPDEAARDFLRKAAEGHDKESGYAEAVAHHDAMHVVLAALEEPPERFEAPPALVHASPEECKAQRQVLDLILSEHPEPLTFPAIGCRLMADPGDFEAGYSLVHALRELVAAGLLQSDGLHVLPTLAALHLVQLWAGR